MIVVIYTKFHNFFLPSYLNLLDIANAENEQPKVLNTLFAMMNVFTINKNSNFLPAVPLECFRGNKKLYKTPN